MPIKINLPLSAEFDLAARAAEHGYVKAEDEWGGGPSETAYCVAAGHMMADHHPLPISMLGRAFITRAACSCATCGS